MGGIQSLFLELSEIYTTFLETLPNWANNFVNLFFMVFIIVIYSVIIWKLYRFIARKDIFPLSVERFHIENRTAFNKFISGTLYLIKNFIVSPLLIFIYYGIFTFILVSLTEDLDLGRILVVSAIIVASIRVTAYYKENLSRDLAKLFPFTLLAVALAEGFFNLPGVIESIGLIPSLISQISIYYLFIIIIEAILRTFDVLFLASGIERQEEVKEG